MSFKTILPQPAASSRFFASTVQSAHFSSIISSVMSSLITFSFDRFKMSVRLNVLIGQPIKTCPNAEYLLFRSSGDLKGFIPFPRRSKANSSALPKTHFSQSGHFLFSAGYSNLPVLHNRKGFSVVVTSWVVCSKG